MASAASGESFFARVRRRWEAGKFLCVGLDPEIERVPAILRNTASDPLLALIEFTRRIIDATAEFACAFKPNSAFYEALGAEGSLALRGKIIAYIHEQHPDVPVILDAKRGDIGSTSAAYARATFDALDADAITLQPYLGAEALRPFLERADRGCFILCRTSNPGAGELQDLRVTTSEAGTAGVSEPLYLYLARQVATTWNTHGNCGLVVGATYPEELAAVRAAVGDLPILVPGIGAQGGDLAAVLRAGRDSRGQGLLISASRSILYASSGVDFADAARAEAQRLSDEIQRLSHQGAID